MANHKNVATVSDVNPDPQAILDGKKSAEESTGKRGAPKGERETTVLRNAHASVTADAQYLRNLAKNNPSRFARDPENVAELATLEGKITEIQNSALALLFSDSAFYISQ